MTASDTPTGLLSGIDFIRKTRRRVPRSSVPLAVCEQTAAGAQPCAVLRPKPLYFPCT